MGNWQLEVGKMCLYMAFPVCCFHYFNQPTNFEEWVIKVRKQMLWEETPEARAEMKEFIEEFSHKERLKMIEAWELSDKKFKELKAKNVSQTGVAID